MLYGGFTFGVENEQNYDNGQLHYIESTLKIKAMMERVKTNDDVPDEPLC